MKTEGARFPQIFTGPGALRLYLASTVVVQHFSRLHLGTWAVYTFFILSGYWISVMYRKKYRFTRMPVLTFWCSRYLRLLPVYLVCTVLMLLLFRICSKAWFDYRVLRDPLWDLRTLLIISSSSQYSVVLGPAWTLDIEMQFYVVAPLLLLALSRMRVAYGVLAAIGATIIGLLAWKSEVLPRYLMFFLAGALIDRSSWRPSGKLAVASMLTFLGLVCVVVLTPALRSLLVFPSVYPSEAAHRFGVLLAFATLPVVGYTLWQPSSEADCHAGNLAYAIYLFHPSVYVIANYLAGFKSPTRVLMSNWAWVLVLPGSLAIYLLVDRPGEVLRKRFVASRVRKAAPAPQNPIAEPAAT